MGCAHSKQQQKKKRQQTNSSADGGAGGPHHAEQEVHLEKQVERFEWQLRLLKGALSAGGHTEWAELLRHHADQELCAVVLSILDKVRTETAVDLNVLHEQKSKAAAEEHERDVKELRRMHQQEEVKLTEKFQALQEVLKGEVDHLKVELQHYHQLQTKVQQSSFQRDLQRNLQAHGSPGAFWESEQESLVFVIEMKTERVQEQNRKLLHMDLLVQEKQALQEQVAVVLQQNEELRVRLANSQELLQQVSREQQELQGALQSQLLLSQNLSQEKEQLLFKLQHCTPSMHLGNMLSELAPR